MRIYFEYVVLYPISLSMNGRIERHTVTADWTEPFIIRSNIHSSNAHYDRIDCQQILSPVTESHTASELNCIAIASRTITMSVLFRHQSPHQPPTPPTGGSGGVELEMGGGGVSRWSLDTRPLSTLRTHPNTTIN